jgi:phosphatidylinositol alpha-mannosyltransferase
MTVSKPRVVISSYDDIKNPYYAGGGARSIAEVANRLSHALNITVLTGNYPGAKDTMLNGVRYKRIGPSFIGPKTSQLLFHFLLPFYLRKTPFDLWIESLTPPFSTSCLQLFTKKPVIGLVHMLSAEEMQRKYFLPFRIVENLGLKTYRNFITPTESTASRLAVLRLSSEIRTIPNGITPPKAAATPAATRYILYIGRIEVVQKGLDLLVAAFNSTEVPKDAKLVIIGSGVAREESKLRKLVQKSEARDRIELLGHVEGARKWRMLQQASAMVVPSREETFGITALEAMACGTPLVTFDIPGLEWIPNNCAVKVETFDSRALSDGIAQVLSNKSFAARISASARRESTHYSWNEIAGQYLDAIEHVLQMSNMQVKEATNGT